MIGKALYSLKGKDPFFLPVVLQQFVTLKIFKQFILLQNVKTHRDKWFFQLLLFIYEYIEYIKNIGLNVQINILYFK